MDCDENANVNIYGEINGLSKSKVVPQLRHPYVNRCDVTCCIYKANHIALSEYIW